MRSYIAKAGGRSYSGGWHGCAHWGIKQVRDDCSLLVKIHAVRAGEKQARVVSEISVDGIREIPNGRYVRLRKLRGANGKV